jgi:hypothetical protein
MTCSGQYATADEYDTMMCSDLDLTDPDILAKINLYLRLAAADINSALSSVGACSCTMDTWAVDYLKKLNILDAAVIQNCPCGNTFTQDEKTMFLEWLNTQFQLIRQQNIELCAGFTGADYPAFATIEQSLTEWSEAGIIANTLERNP